MLKAFSSVVFFKNKPLKMSGEKLFWTEFFELYKESPALWRIKSSEYSNRVMKVEAYEKLVNKLKEKYPDAYREMVVKKINTFRTTYRKEFKKVKSIEKSGAGTEDVYEPTLWYYNILSFLEDQEDSAPSTCTMGDKTQEQTSPKTSALPHRQKKRKLSEEDNLIKIACEHLQAQNMYSNLNNNDPDNAVAKVWGSQLKEMKPEQKILARKLISDVLFEGIIGNLNKLHIQEFSNFVQSIPSSTISYEPIPSPAEFANTSFTTISSGESQDSIQEYFSNFE